MTDMDEDEMHVTSLPAPPITDAVRAEAKSSPDAWVYAVDPGFGVQAEVPPEGIVGAWHSDEKGEISADFVPNPRYRPTPQARGWEEPATRLERVLQLVLSGYMPDAQLASEFAQAEVYIFSNTDGGIFLAPAQDGGRLVYAYTDASKAADSGYTERRATTGAELAEALPPGVRIALNVGSPVSAIIQPEDVTAT